MITIERKTEKKQTDSTIALINIVFLMLIFFLIAGRIAPPLDAEINLAEAETAPRINMPDSLVILNNGSLRYLGKETSLEDFWKDWISENGASAREIEVLADKKLNAQTLLEVVARLRQKGATEIHIVTVVGG